MADDDDVNRKHVHNFNDPLFDYNKYGGIYNPLLYPFVVADMLVILYWFIWHRFQSLKARRQSIHTNLRLQLREHQRIYSDDNSTHKEKKEAKKNIRQLLYICDQLNLQSKVINEIREDVMEDS